MPKISPSELILQADRKFQIGNYDETIALCRKGITSFPDFPSFYSLLSQAYIKLGQIREAIGIVEQAIELFPFQRTFQFLLDSLNNEIVSTSKESIGLSIHRPSSKRYAKVIQSVIASMPFGIVSQYFPYSRRNIFVNAPRNYFASRIDLQDFPKPRNIGLRNSISRLINQNF